MTKTLRYRIPELTAATSAEAPHLGLPGIAPLRLDLPSRPDRQEPHHD